jgi:hypothetical protein
MVRGNTTIHLDPAVLEEVSPLLGREMLVRDGHLKSLLATLGTDTQESGMHPIQCAYKHSTWAAWAKMWSKNGPRRSGHSPF